MKKALGILALLTVFAFGFGAGQYFYEKGLTIPGLAMASAKPNFQVRLSNFKQPDAPHKWGLFIETDRPIDAIDRKSQTKAALYFK